MGAHSGPADWWTENTDEGREHVATKGIVQSDLVLNLDAGVNESYPGTGTTWYDLSGNGNHATLFNSPTFTNNIFTFDGTNQYVRTANNIDFTPYTSITFEVTFKPTIGSGGMLIEHTSNWNSQTGGFGMAINSNGTAFSANLCHSNHRPAGGAWGRNNPSLTNNGVWLTQSSVFSRVVDSNGRYVIENGELKPFTSSPFSSSTATNTTTGFVNSILYIGSRAGTTSFYSGDISAVRVYGKKIDLTEHTKNFNATRNRYGI